MKKYLITGAMALMAGFYLTSCTHDDIGYDNLYEEKTQTFEKVFKDLYGNIDPNHDWGFTPYAIDGLTTTNATRALTRGHDARANMWAGDGWIVPDPLTPQQKDKVRRWFQQHQNPEGVSFNYSNFFVQQVYKGGTTVGSYSPEIYTAASGTTTFAGSDHMDYLSCGSYDEGASGEFNSGRNIYDHINNFNDGTYDHGKYNDKVQNNDLSGYHSDQIMLMVDSKSNCFGYWNSNASVGFNNKYVIIPGDVIQADDPNSPGDVSGMYFVGLDFEQAVETAYTNDYYTGPDGNKYRYLDSNMNEYCGDKKEYNDVPSAETIQGLLDQGYLPVASKAGKVFVKLASCADGYYSDWIVRVTPGFKKSSGGETPKPEETTTSSKYRAKRHQIWTMGRVFVEDLYNANRADIDYNDAVFDGIIWVDYDVQVTNGDKDHPVQINVDQKKYRVEIALLAAGGTIPLTIAGPTKNEHGFGDVHSAFGVGLTTMVNTVGDASDVFGSYVTGHKYAYHEFDYTSEIARIAAEKGGISLNDIPIEVKWETGTTTVAAILNNKDTHTYKRNADGTLYVNQDKQLEIDEENSTAAIVPHVIQVPIGTAWSQERVNIGLTNEGPYRDFPKYVSNHNYDCWTNNVKEEYLYPDYRNSSPLAYANKWPSWYYETDIVEGIIIWEGSQDFSDWNSPKVSPTPSDLFKSYKQGQKIRLYGEVINPGNDWGLQLFDGMWNQGKESQKEGYNDGKLLEASNVKDCGFNQNGYVEWTLDNKLLNILTKDTEWGVACNIQGLNFRLKYVTIVD